MLRPFDGHSNAATAGMEAESALEDTRQQRLVDDSRRRLDAKHRCTTKAVAIPRLHAPWFRLPTVLLAAVVVMVSFEVQA